MITDPIGLEGSRGLSLFSPDQLDRILRTTVLPEVDDQHHLTIVGSTTESGARAAIVFRKAWLSGE